MKKLTIILCAFCILGGSFSCSDMLETESSRQIFDPNLGDKTDSIYYALGILQAMQQLADPYFFQNEMRGDLVELTEYTDKNLRQLAEFSTTTANKYDSAYVYYRVINNCNYYIAHRNTSLRTGANYVTMNEFAAIKAIRAWAYLQLTRIYGKVPFYTEPLTEISQINNNKFPELNMKGIVDELAPDLEKYTGYPTPNFGNVSPVNIAPAQLFIPVDVILGDMYLETQQYDKAAQHYITYLTKVAGEDNFHTAYMQEFSRTSNHYKSIQDNFPSDISGNGLGEYNKGSDTWSNIFSGTYTISNIPQDIVTYIPMAPDRMQGTITDIPLIFGYDYYSTTTGYVDEIQIAASKSYKELSDSTEFYYVSNSGSEENVIKQAKIGDARFDGIIRERNDDEIGKTNTWITKNRIPRVILYRMSTIWLRLAEALNRLGMYDAAFAILKDGISQHLIKSVDEGGPKYISDDTKNALQTTYPLLSEANIARFNTETNKKVAYGVHMHGAGITCDFTGVVYQPGMSPYQLETVAGVKMKKIAKEYLVAVGTTAADTINAIEDLICDEYALESSFEGNRFGDLCRIARHKNNASPYGANFGSQWLAKKLAYKNPSVALTDENNWYLPFK